MAKRALTSMRMAYLLLGASIGSHIDNTRTLRAKGMRVSFVSYPPVDDEIGCWIEQLIDPDSIVPNVGIEFF
jgi:hypothetical protein